MKKFTGFIAEKLELHAELNPKLWNGDELKEPVRDRLMTIAKEWARYAGIPWSFVQDVLLCGGNANYNYTKYSDVDVHLLVYRNALGFGAFADDYLKDKKKLWSIERKGISVGGYPVELYAQDASEAAPSGQGVYSIKNNSWNIHPDHPDVDKIDDVAADLKSDDYRKRIDQAIEAEDDSELIELKKSIAKGRKAGISVGGEFSVENLVFKQLRNDGYLQKIDDYLGGREDDRLSYKGD